VGWKRPNARRKMVLEQDSLISKLIYVRSSFPSISIAGHIIGSLHIHNKDQKIRSFHPMSSIALNYGFSFEYLVFLFSAKRYKKVKNTTFPSRLSKLHPHPDHDTRHIQQLNFSVSLKAL